MARQTGVDTLDARLIALFTVAVYRLPGGVAAAVIGPSLVRVTHDLVMPLYLATYATIFVLHIIVFTIMSFITFPSVATSAAVAGHAEAAAPPRPRSNHRPM